METIAFYAYKGGTGRTLVVANVARYLALFGQRVVAVDFDLEAPGLHYKLNLDISGNPVDARFGVVDYLNAFITEKTDRSIKEFLVPIQTSPNSSGTIHLLAAGSVLSADYWRKLSRIDWHQMFYDSTVGMHFFLELKERIRKEVDPDFLLIDSRTGITDIAGVATSVMADKVVCLLLNNRENVEGLRSVLRSFRQTPRPPGAKELEVFAAVTRIPNLASTYEEELVAQLLKSLNNDSSQLPGPETTALKHLFVLHSEPALEIKESLRVGEEIGVEKSRLLRDYIRLFSKIIPREVIAPHVGKLLSQTREIAFDDPDAAERSLESITQSLGDADAYQELLKLYRLRNVTGEKVIRAAQRLWEVDRYSNPDLVWQTVQTQIPALSRLPEPVDENLLKFASDVWRHSPSDDKKFLSVVAMELSGHSEYDAAADLLLEYLRKFGPDGSLVSKSMLYLGESGRQDEVEDLIRQYTPVLMGSPEFVVQLARYALENSRSAILADLLKPSVMAILTEAQPLIAYRVAASSGRLDEAQNLAERVLESAIRRRSPGELQRVKKLFEEIGRSREFEEATRRLPPSIANRVLGSGLVGPD